MSTPDIADALEIADFLAGSMGRWHSRAPAMLRELATELQNAHEAWEALSAHAEKLRAEVEALRRGEFICQKCGLRKDADAGPVPF